LFRNGSFAQSGNEEEIPSWEQILAREEEEEEEVVEYPLYLYISRTKTHLFNTSSG
jgi:hypothetical protein